MSLHPHESYCVPPETARIAKACFPHGNRYLQLADELGVIFRDADFADLYPPQGQPTIAPVRLALALVLQYAENLSDRQAADAVRSRIDWKYVLCLELTDPGFDHTVLSEFRTRLVRGNASTRLFDRVLDLCRERGLVKTRGRQRTDSTHVLAAVSALNRVECVGEAMRHALNHLAVQAPDWLRSHIQPAWFARYGPRIEDYHLPKTKDARHALAEQIGADGLELLHRALVLDAPTQVRDDPAIAILRHIWLQNYTWQDARLVWRANDNIPPAAQFIASPYDRDAHYARKHTTQWIGYKVHLTEGCDDDVPPVITHVATTPATLADGDVTPLIHAALARKGLLPQFHIVDTGYLDAKLLVTSRDDYAVELCGPTRHDWRWQAQAGQGFAAADFVIDWEHQHATCPRGKRSSSWTPAIDGRKNEVIKIKFSTKDCGSCEVRSHYTQSRRLRRSITIRPKAQYQALQEARTRARTRDYTHEQWRREGIEGTLSYGVRGCGLRRSRYRGLARTHVQHVLTATAMNLLRLSRWFAGEARAPTRQAPFLQLRFAPASMSP